MVDTRALRAREAYTSCEFESRPRHFPGLFIITDLLHVRVNLIFFDRMWDFLSSKARSIREYGIFFRFESFSIFSELRSN